MRNTAALDGDRLRKLTSVILYHSMAFNKSHNCFHWRKSLRDRIKIGMSIQGIQKE